MRLERPDPVGEKVDRAQLLARRLVLRSLPATPEHFVCSQTALEVEKGPLDATSTFDLGIRKEVVQLGAQGAQADEHLQRAIVRVDLIWCEMVSILVQEPVDDSERSLGKLLLVAKSKIGERRDDGVARRYQHVLCHREHVVVTNGKRAVEGVARDAQTLDPSGERPPLDLPTHPLVPAGSGAASVRASLACLIDVVRSAPSSVAKVVKIPKLVAILTPPRCASGYYTYV